MERIYDGLQHLYDNIHRVPAFSPSPSGPASKPARRIPRQEVLHWNRWKSLNGNH